MPPVSLELSSPGVWDFSNTTELDQLLYMQVGKLMN